MDICLLLKRVPFGGIGKIGILHPVHKGFIVVLFFIKIRSFIDHPVFHQNAVIHLVMLTEILFVVPLQYVAVVPVLSIEVHLHGDATLEGNRPIRNQIPNYGIGKSAFQHDGVG